MELINKEKNKIKEKGRGGALTRWNPKPQPPHLLLYLISPYSKPPTLVAAASPIPPLSLLSSSSSLTTSYPQNPYRNPKPERREPNQPRQRDRGRTEAAGHTTIASTVLMEASRVAGDAAAETLAFAVV